MATGSRQTACRLLPIHVRANMIADGDDHDDNDDDDGDDDDDDDDGDDDGGAAEEYEG
jgi:hypothetical protein